MTPGALLLALVPCSGDEWDGLRSRIASAGDVNRDGTPDLLVASRATEIGTVWVLDGREGCRLLSVAGEAAGDGFGRSLSGVGDVDRDGHADFAVGAYPYAGSQEKLRGAPPELALGKAGLGPTGYVAVFSGLDGALLRRWSPTSTEDGFGSCVAAGADIDGDGFDDIGVQGSSLVCVYSGRSGEALGSAEGDWFRSPLCFLPAVGRDHAPALLIAHRSGRLEALKGKGLETITTLPSMAGFCEGRRPWSMSNGGDADRDQVPDLLVSFIHCGFAVVSGATLEPLHVIAPYEMDSRVDMSAAGSSVDWLGDIDRDGHDDFVVAANESDSIRFPSRGFAHVYSGRTGEKLRAYEPVGKRMDACRAGDANLDGIPDVAVFVVEDRAVRVLSGSDLHVVWEILIEDLRR